jgi:hypothetical protein
MKNTDIPDLYRIKYWPKLDKLDVRFGQVERYTEDAEKYWAKGYLIISDAITGEPNLVPFADIEYQPKELKFSFDLETGLPDSTEYDLHILKAYKEHKKRDEAAGEGLHVHRMFAIQVADGHANYVVTKVNKKTCKIEWRNFGADNYTCPILGWGGTFPVGIIERQIHHADGIKKLFSKSA